jgi:Cu+-exporting ATPase
MPVNSEVKQMRREEVYIVDGMTCAACSSAVERIAGKLEGVEVVSVNLATGKMSIAFDEAVVTQDTIFKKIEKAGYHPKEDIQLKEIIIPVEGMT